MIETTNRRGYAAANVSAVIGEAGVSRPTFYDYFIDRNDCFRAAIEDVQADLLARVSSAVEGQAPEHAMAHAIVALVSYAGAERARARFLMGESMAGGAGALDARDQGIEQLSIAIEGALKGASPDTQLADIDPRVLIGSLYRMLATLLRRGELASSRLADELTGWVAHYERPLQRCRWRKLTAGPASAPSPHVPSVPVQEMPSVFPPGRPRVPEEQIAENHRLRILYAAARLAEEKGYTDTTVADITRLASVDGRVFYRHFSDKQEAFTAVHELGFQQVMDVTAKAFFDGSDWPERSWEGGRALTQLLQANPLVARVGFVEAYAVGPRAVQRIEDSHTAFVFFLQEGLMNTNHEPPPSRVAMEAIIAAVFEIIYLQTRARTSKVAGMLPYVAHLWLSPFLGVEEADQFIDERLSQESARP